MFKVIVDGDACPRSCLKLLRQHKSRWGYRLLTVASVDHRIENSDHIIVGRGKDATDLVVVNRATAGDIVVTEDLGLTALVLAKAVFTLSFSGRIYSKQNIDFILEERAIKARFRRLGGRTRGPRVRTAQDDFKFEESLLRLLAEASER